MDVHTRAHHLYTLRILWCISSTLHPTPITINKLQIQHVRVQRCTSRVCSLRSVFRLWTKIFIDTVSKSFCGLSREYAKIQRLLKVEATPNGAQECYFLVGNLLVWLSWCAFLLIHWVVQLYCLIFSCLEAYLPRYSATLPREERTKDILMSFKRPKCPVRPSKRLYLKMLSHFL